MTASMIDRSNHRYCVTLNSTRCNCLSITKLCLVLWYKQTVRKDYSIRSMSTSRVSRSTRSISSRGIKPRSFPMSPRRPSLGCGLKLGSKTRPMYSTVQEGLRVVWACSLCWFFRFEFHVHRCAQCFFRRTTITIDDRQVSRDPEGDAKVQWWYRFFFSEEKWCN